MTTVNTETELKKRAVLMRLFIGAPGENRTDADLSDDVKKEHSLVRRSPNCGVRSGTGKARQELQRRHAAREQARTDRRPERGGSDPVEAVRLQTLTEQPGVSASPVLPNFLNENSSASRMKHFRTVRLRDALNPQVATGLCPPVLAGRCI